MKTTKKSASQEPASGEALGDLGHEDPDAPRSTHWARIITGPRWVKLWLRTSGRVELLGTRGGAPLGLGAPLGSRGCARGDSGTLTEQNYN
ncbi:GABA permease GabA [Aspergillus luchuensis]|uniref:GABA permease GabA n=1 Tax=Aspergillus kawachii TaxID=1069201 RepID=A0A146FKS1_ASPKA|nr:GABA permease GabA [Aspergillus luchuensis]